MKKKLTTLEAHQERINRILKTGTAPKYVIVNFRCYGTGYKINLPGLLKDDKTTTTIPFYHNATLNRNAALLAKELTEKSPFEKQDNGWVLLEDEVLNIVNDAKIMNDEIDSEARLTRDNWDVAMDILAGTVADICQKNRCKSRTAQMQKIARRNAPAQSQIVSGIELIIRRDDTQLYDDYLASTQELLDQTKMDDLMRRRRSNIAKRCNPIIENLAKFSHQIAEGKLHGGTINSYNNAVEVLRVANPVELDNLPEINDFIKIASYAVDAPVASIDSLLMGFMRFYYTQGLLDYVPYDALDEAYDRSFVQKIGEEAENSFSAIAAALPEQIAMFD